MCGQGFTSFVGVVVLVVRVGTQGSPSDGRELLEYFRVWVRYPYTLNERLYYYRTIPPP